MEDTPTYTCASCPYFGKSVRDSDITGVPVDARYCGHPTFNRTANKSLGPNTPACVYHPRLKEELERLRTNTPSPFWGLQVHTNFSTYNFVAPIAHFMHEFANNLEIGGSTAPAYPPGSALTYAVAYALTNTRTDEFVTALTHALSGTIVATFDPLFNDVQRDMQDNIDTAVGMVEERYAPICREVELLRREVEELKNENSSSVGLPLGTAVEDEI